MTETKETFSERNNQEKEFARAYSEAEKVYTKNDRINKSKYLPKK